jgi:two-component system cell cycle sensor histidine kinase/response regulator CckA
VLVIEDDPAVRHLIDRVLTRCGHHVLTAPSPVQAAALLLDFSEPLDVGLLDLITPGMDCLAYGRQLQHQFPGIRIMFMTGWLDRPEVADLVEQGLLLPKPFTPEELCDVVGTK